MPVRRTMGRGGAAPVNASQLDAESAIMKENQRLKLQVGEQNAIIMKVSTVVALSCGRWVAVRGSNRRVLPSAQFREGGTEGDAP